MPIAAMIQKNLTREAARIALITESETLTFADLSQKMSLWHNFLDELEVKVGDRVAVILENSSRLVVIHGGNLCCGRITVPVNPRQTTSEIERLLADAQPALVVTCAESAGRVRQALANIGQTAHVLDEHLIRSSLSGAKRCPPAKSVNITDLMPAMIVYTSGTTGTPKGAVLSQGNLEASATSLHQAWEFSNQDHLLLTLPLFHVHGLGIGIHGMLTSGFSVTLEKKFHPDAVAKKLSKQDDGFTMFFGVPTYYHRLLNRDGAQVSFRHLRLCVSGSAPLAESLHSQFESQFEIRILERYGMSETMMNISNPFFGQRHAGFVGQPLPGVSIKIVDASGQELPEGDEGEIYVKGKNVFSGYWQKPDATIAAFDEGWFKTGDLGRFDASLGSFQITGRSKELIISGGYNIHPQEIENALRTCPGLEDYAVTGTPDHEYGEVVTIFVAAENEGITLEALRAHCHEKLSAYKIPKRLVVVTSIPRNALGKVQRTRLRSMVN